MGLFLVSIYPTRSFRIRSQAKESMAMKSRVRESVRA
jgi:hypothetical protein